MEVLFDKKFKKQYKLPPKKYQDKIEISLSKFMINPLDAELKNHKLNGRLKGLRAISAANDLRIIFLEKGNYQIVYMIAVGSHNQVY
jgi:addiction module RelE/StbE family toxin